MLAVADTSQIDIGAPRVENEQSREKIAHDLIKSFKNIKSVNGYIDDRRHINAHIASNLLKLNYRGQRDIKADMVTTLTKAMSSKHKYSPNNVIAISYNPDRPNDTSMIALLNGQHTLQAITRSNTTWPLMVSLYPCRSIDEIQHHYSLFDQGRIRNQKDISQAAGLGQVVVQRKLPAAAMATLGSSAKLIRSHLMDTREGGRDKLGNARLILEWIDEADKAYTILAPKNRASHILPLGEISRAVRKRLLSPLLFPIILVALRSHPDETEIMLVQILECADGGNTTDDLLWQVVVYLANLRAGNGSDRRIAERNFSHILSMLRRRSRTGEAPESLDDVIIDSTPTRRESEELWDVVTEDRLDRSVASV